MGSPVWISHRGFCQDHEENSAQAFRAACAIGFEHLETDLRTTADGHIVLAHDPTMERLTGTTHTIESSPRTLLEKMSLRGGEKLLFFDQDRKSTRLNSSHVAISYAVFCLKKKKKAKSGAN